jgi:hypothetical protein
VTTARQVMPRTWCGIAGVQPLVQTYQKFGSQPGFYRSSESRRDHSLVVIGPPVAGILSGQAVGIRAIDGLLAQDRCAAGAMVWLLGEAVRDDLLEVRRGGAWRRSQRRWRPRGHRARWPGLIGLNFRSGRRHLLIESATRNYGYTQTLGLPRAYVRSLVTGQKPET